MGMMALVIPVFAVIAMLCMAFMACVIFVIALILAAIVMLMVVHFMGTTAFLPGFFILLIGSVTHAFYLP